MQVDDSINILIDTVNLEQEYAKRDPNIKFIQSEFYISETLTQGIILIIKNCR